MNDLNLTAQTIVSGNILVAQWNEELGDYGSDSVVIAINGDTATLRDPETGYEWTASVAAIKSAVVSEDEGWTIDQAIAAVRGE